MLRHASILLGLALIPATIAGLFHPKRPDWKSYESQEISLENALKLKSVLWVDARSASAYEVDHISGALLLNEDEWDRQLPMVLQTWSPERSIIVYCSSRQCQASHHIAQRLKVVGVSPIYVLKGGWEIWLQHSKN